MDGPQRRSKRRLMAFQLPDLGDESLYSESVCCSDDVIYSGSEDEYYENAAARTRRYEAQARQFLEGRRPILLSASLRGPFGSDSGWTNPWLGHGGRVVKSKPERVEEKAILRTETRLTVSESPYQKKGGEVVLRHCGSTSCASVREPCAYLQKTGVDLPHKKSGPENVWLRRENLKRMRPNDHPSPFASPTRKIRRNVSTNPTNVKRSCSAPLAAPNMSEEDSLSLPNRNAACRTISTSTRRRPALGGAIQHTKNLRRAMSELYEVPASGSKPSILNTAAPFPQFIPGRRADNEVEMGEAPPVTENEQAKIEPEQATWSVPPASNDATKFSSDVGGANTRSSKPQSAVVPDPCSSELSDIPSDFESDGEEMTTEMPATTVELSRSEDVDAIGINDEQSDLRDRSNGALIHRTEDSRVATQGEGPVTRLSILPEDGIKVEEPDNAPYSSPYRSNSVLGSDPEKDDGPGATDKPALPFIHKPRADDVCLVGDALPSSLPQQLTSPTSPSCLAEALVVADGQSEDFQGGSYSCLPSSLETATPSTPDTKQSSLPTPDQTFSIKSFRRFQSPSPTPRPRRRNAKAGILRLSTGRHKIKDGPSGFRSIRRVQFLLPDDGDESTGHGSSVPLEEHRPARPSSPPPPEKVVPDNLPGEVDNFQNYYVTVASRASQQALQAATQSRVLTSTNRVIRNNIHESPAATEAVSFLHHTDRIAETQTLLLSKSTNEQPKIMSQDKEHDDVLGGKENARGTGDHMVDPEPEEAEVDAVQDVIDNLGDFLGLWDVDNQLAELQS